SNDGRAYRAHRERECGRDDVHVTEADGAHVGEEGGVAHGLEHRVRDDDEEEAAERGAHAPRFRGPDVEEPKHERHHRRTGNLAKPALTSTPIGPKLLSGMIRT